MELCESRRGKFTAGEPGMRRSEGETAVKSSATAARRLSNGRGGGIGARRDMFAGLCLEL